MTLQQQEMLLWALANGHPCNTSNDYSVSIVKNDWAEPIDYDVTVFPAAGRPFFIDMAVDHLLGIAKALNLHFSFESRLGVPVANFR